MIQRGKLEDTSAKQDKDIKKLCQNLSSTTLTKSKQFKNVNQGQIEAILTE